MAETGKGESSMSEIETKILEIAQSKTSGISNKDILDGIPGLESATLAQSINKLIKQG